MKPFVPPTAKTVTGPRVTTIRSAPPTTVAQTVTVTRPDGRATDVGKEPAEWTPVDLQAYVVRQIEQRFGPFPMQGEPAKLSGIFKAFCGRHGTNAGPIAVAAFETFGGYWKGSPISVTRFCKKSDPYFSLDIVERLGTGRD